MAPDKTPDDAFMYSRRRDLRPAFVKTLKQELDAQAVPSAPDNTSTHAGFVMPGHIWQRVAGVLLVLAGLFTVSFSMSPDVRAMTRSLLGIEGEVPLEIAQQAIGFELPQYLPNNLELVTLCSSAIDTDCNTEFPGEAWVNISEEGSGWAFVYYTRPGLDDNERWTALTLSVRSLHPDTDIDSYIERMETRWRDLGDIGDMYNAPRINGAVGYQTYRTHEGIARSTKLEWFQGDLQYTLHLYNISLEMPTEELLREARQIARSIPVSEVIDTP